MTKPYSIVRLLLATVCVAALLTAPTMASDAILKVIPKESLAFAVVNNLGNTDEVCAELGKATQFPIPSPTMILKQATGLDDALNLDGDMAIVFYNNEEGLQNKPPMFIVLPVKDYKKQLSKFDAEGVTDEIKKITINETDVLVASKEGFMILGQERHQAAFEEFLASKENIADEMKPWKTWSEKNVAYGILTNHGVKAFLKEGIGSFEGMIESFEQFGQSEQINKVKKTLQVYLTIMKGIRENVNQIGAGLSTSDSGVIKVSTRCDAVSGGKWAKMLDEVKALPSDPIAVLPSTSYVFAAGGPIPQKAVGALMEIAQTMGAGQMGLDEEQNAKMIKLSIDALKNITGESLVFGAPSPEDKALVNNTYAAMWVKDADAFLGDYDKQVKEMNEVFSKEETPMMTMEVEEKTINGQKALMVTTDMSGMFARPEMMQVAGMLESIYGEDYKMVSYIAKVTDTLVVTVIGDEDRLAKAIEVAKTQSGSLADGSGIKEVAALLPKDAQWFVYWSPAGTVDIANWIIAKLPEQIKVGMPFEKLPAFPECPPIGIAAKVGNGVVEKTFVITPDTLRSMMMYYMQLQMMGAH